MQRLTAEDFVEKAKARHGKVRYDYSRVEYRRSHDKVAIGCNECGVVFEQMARNHIQGRGCLRCGGTLKLTTTEFIKRAEACHGKGRYGYGQVDYRSSKSSVTIICNKCDDVFKQTANSHIRGYGCPKCSIRERSRDPNDLISEFKEIHGENRYGYEKVVERFQSVDHTVPIWCRVCREFFLQTPTNHLKGHGCPKCGDQAAANARRRDPDEVIAAFKKVHGSKYGYKKTAKYYKDTQTKAPIWCRRCKTYFYQRPCNHLQGSGCPTCFSSKGEYKVNQWLKQHAVVFIREWMGHDCHITYMPLRFDFYLPQECPILIEFDGVHHFEPVIYFNGGDKKRAEANFKSIRKHDKFKNRWAKKNGFVMIRIRYDEDIENVLNTKLLPLLTDAA